MRTARNHDAPSDRDREKRNSRSAVGSSTSSTRTNVLPSDDSVRLEIGLGDRVHTRADRNSAFAFGAVLVIITIAGLSLGNVRGPEYQPFIPIAATTWSLADLMTALLLLTQFRVNGTRFLTHLASAYAVAGLLTWPYMTAFPGISGPAPSSVANQQISAWLWAVWHMSFPIIVLVATLVDPDQRAHMTSRRAINSALYGTIGLSCAFAIAVGSGVFVFKTHLPAVVMNGHLTATFSHVLAPTAAILNALSIVALVRRGTRLTSLQLWLVVALFSETLDSCLNSYSPIRFSYGWYLGKLETVLTSGVVLTALVCEVASLSRRLTELAVIDPLTNLYNRRAFDHQIITMLRYVRRSITGLGLIVIDIDFFKGYNDAYGHGCGDECLRRVAQVIQRVACRPLDHVSRYGGEEFVVILPDTSAEGTALFAQRLVTEVFRASIPYANTANGVVTISTGAVHHFGLLRTSIEELFGLADVALYDAKHRGRNQSVMHVDPGSSAVTCLSSAPNAFPVT